MRILIFRFEFFDVLPGQYTVKGSHDHWKFLTASSQVQLSKERWEIEQPIVIRGYTLKVVFFLLISSIL